MPGKKARRVRERIDGLKAIAHFLNLSEAEVRLCYAITVPPEDRIPVFPLRPGGGPNRRLSAWVDELENWMDLRAEKHLYRKE